MLTNNNIQRLILNEQGNVGDISLKLESFAEALCKFADVHENYLGLLESESYKQNAVTSYEEQMKRKLSLDGMVMEWRKMTKIERVIKDEAGGKCSKSKGSRSWRSERSTSSSKMSTISKKKEEMALVQLKVYNS